MAQSGRPLSPHLGIYRWQVQMVTSILHRATGIALAAGTLLVLWGLMALAAGPEPGRLHRFRRQRRSDWSCCLGWTWALMFHLCNGIRHLLQDTGMGFECRSSCVPAGWRCWPAWC